MKTNLFQSCGHWWVFQIFWYIECSILTPSSFQIWNSSIGILSPPLAFLIMMLLMAYLTLHSRMSGSGWMIKPTCISGSWYIYIYILVGGVLKSLQMGDCSHEIKRCLLLGRKGMTNLDSILKSRDITFPTKVCPVKAMVFLVVMYGCELDSIEKAEHRRIDAFELWGWTDSWEALQLQGDPTSPS